MGVSDRGTTEVPLSDGWTAQPYVEGMYVYVEWIRTGSRDPVPDIPPMLPWEAEQFAESLTDLVNSNSFMEDE